MNRSGAVAIALAIATLLTGPFAPSARSAPSPTLVTLRNGLRVVLAPDSFATATDVAVWYDAGIGDELPGALGTRHLLERLMFRGTPGVPDGEYSRRLGAEGVSTSTSLHLDYSCTYQTLPAEALDLALRLEADRMAGLKPSQEAFDECRRATLADARGRDSRPVVQRAIARLGAGVYAGLAYASPVEGDEAVLARATPATVEAWRRSHYVPSAAVLTVVGRFEPSATLERIRTLFEQLPRGKSNAPSRRRPSAPTGERREWRQGSDLPARLLLAGWRVPGMTDADAPVIELLGAVLSSGESPRFTQAMTRTWGTASFAQCGLDRHREASMLWTITALRPGADSAATEQQVIDQVRGLAREPLSEAELGRIRNQFITAERVRSQSVRARAQTLGDAMLEAGDVGFAERRLAALDKLTPADLQRVATRVLADESRTVVWMVPTGGGE